MLPGYTLTIEGKSIKPETKEFLNGVLLALINALVSRGVDTKEAELLGTNDIFAFRGTNVVVFSLSRSRRLLQPLLSELPLSEAVPTEQEITADRPGFFAPPGWGEFLKDELKCVSAVSVAFPISYLSLKNDELKEADRKVAEVLVQPAQQDVERKKRVARVNPVFRGRDFLVEGDLCFVLLEFAKPYTDIYDAIIRPMVEGESLRCLKSDDIFTTTSVIEDIWANINKAALIIADISSNNPNVMYELGVCHTVGKNVMMITQRPEEIPFNFRHMRCYPYTNDARGLEELKSNIRSVIQHMRATQEL
jgi:hypothetical protein